MSLKITDSNGFKIGGVLNPSISEIYVRVLADMTKEKAIKDDQERITDVSIRSNAKVTLNGGRFDEPIQVDYIFPTYWLEYSSSVTDMNSQYLEIEEDLKAKLISNNPEWDGKIEIVTLGV